MRLSRWVFILSISLLAVSCNSIFGPMENDDFNWHMLESGHFIFYYLPNSYAEQNIGTMIQHLEAHYRRVIGILEINYSGIISVYLYNSPHDANRSSCGGTAYPRTETVKVVCSLYCGGAEYSAAAHEIVHVISHNALGEPGTFLLSEGLAEAMEETQLWNGKHFHAWVKQYMEQGKLPSLNTLANNFKWQKTDDGISYPVAGSFVFYLIDTYGIFKIKELFYRATSGNFSEEFRNIYGKILEEVESDWKNYCRAWI